jgi:ketosteroid isomerase-like protein
MRAAADTSSAADGNRQLVERLFQTVDRRAWDALPRLFADEVVYERPGYPLLIGIAEVLRFYREVRRIASGAHHLEEIITDGNRGACLGRFVGRLRDGTAVDVRFADAYTFENGKIWTRCTYFFRPAV